MTLTQITEKGIKDGEIVNADINASAAIAKSKLASLDIVNGDINASAAIAKSKLASLDIVNGDINASAAIAGSKISPSFTSSLSISVGSSGTNASTGFDELTIEGGNEDIGMCFISPAANERTHTIAFGDSNNNNAGKIQYNHSTDDLTLTASDNIILTGDGVGIGTTSPNQLLEVANSSGGATISISTDQQPGSVASKKYNNLDFTGYNNIVMARIQSWDESSSTGQGFLTFHTHLHNTGLQEHLRIMNDGKVGIGTTSPAQLFHVNGQAKVNSLGIGQDAGSSTLAITGNMAINTTGNTAYSKFNIAGSGSTTGSAFTINNYGDAEGDYYHFGVNATQNASGNNSKTNTAKRSAAVRLDGRLGSIVLQTSQTSTSTIDEHFTFDRGGDFTLAGNVVVASGKGIDFGATSDATGKTSELFDDYEEGTWTPSLNKVGATGNADGSVGSRAGYYIKCGSMLWVSFYWYSANLSFGTGTYAWYIANLPYNLLHNINSAYQFIPGGYLYQNGHTGVSHQAGYRWQSNNANGADTLTMYGQGNTTNASGGAYEFSGCGVLRTT